MSPANPPDTPLPTSRAPRRVFLLRLTAIVNLALFLAFGLSVTYFVAQFFICPRSCPSTPPPWLLVATSIFFALIPAVGTTAIGVFMSKGLWDDANGASPHWLEEMRKPTEY